MGGRVLSGVLSVFGGKLGTKLLGVAITPLLVRVLGAGSYGDYAFVLSVLGVATILVHMGTSAGIRKYIAEEREGDRWREQVFAFYFRVGVVLAVLGAAAVALLAAFAPVERWLGEGFGLYLLLVGVVLLAQQFLYVFRYTLMGLHLERYSEPLVVLRKLAFGVLGLSLAYAGLDVAGLLVGKALAALLAAAVAASFLGDRLSLSAVLRPVDAGFPRRRLLAFNLQNTVFVLLTVSLYHVDVLLLQPLVGSERTGFYKAALVVAEFVWVVPIAVQTVFVHSASELWSTGQREAVTELASRATRYTLSITLLLVVGIAALSREFVTIYFGPDFLAASTALLFLLPGVVGFAVARPIYAVGQAKGELRTLIYATGSAAALNLALNLLLIPRFGLVGAATATSVGYGSMLVVHVWSARRLGYDPLADLRPVRVLAATLPTAVVVFGLASAIDGRLLSLAVVPPAGLLVHAVATVKLGVVDADELDLLEPYLPAPVHRALVGALADA